MILDTYKEVEHLKNRGASSELAEAIVDLHTKSDAHLVTRKDLIITEQNLRSDLKEFRHEIRSDLKEFRAEFQKEILEVKGDIKSLHTSANWSMAIVIAILTIILSTVIKFPL